MCEINTIFINWLSVFCFAKIKKLCLTDGKLKKLNHFKMQCYC